MRRIVSTLCRVLGGRLSKIQPLSDYLQRCPVSVGNQRRLFGTISANLSNTIEKSLAGCPAAGSTMEKDAIAFRETFELIIKDLTTVNEDQESDAVAKHIDRMTRYNVGTGKNNRGMSVVSTYRILVPQHQQTDENLKLTRVLGWCLELLQTTFLVADDMMDSSITRRGQLCWHKLDDVGLSAINDVLLMEANLHFLLRKYCTGKTYYVDLFNLFQEITRKTICGQHVDTSIPKKENLRPDLDAFTMERYNHIVKYKTAYYTISLPIRVAMYMAGHDSIEIHKEAESILLKIGHWFQVQDDYLDCFGNPEVTGKIGTDIEDGKSCWPIVKALEVANAEQRTVLEENYGIADEERVAKVKEVYGQLKIEDLYLMYEEEQYHQICKLIDDVSRSSQLPADIFYNILNKLYKRKK